MQLIDLPAPTSDYSYYFPLTSAEMTKAYIEQFEELSTEIPEIETLEVLEIAEAMDAPKTTIPLMSAAGCVSGEFVYLYPPGIPILAPG